MLKIQVNGKVEQVESGIAVRKLLEAKGINPHVVACELNLKILKRTSLDDVILKDGDILEIIQMIGGG